MKFETDRSVVSSPDLHFYNKCHRYLLSLITVPSMKYKLFIAFAATFILSIAVLVLEVSVIFTSYRTIVFLDASVGFFLLALVTVLYLTRKPTRKGSRKIAIRVYKMLMSLPVFLIILYVMGVNIEWPILLIGLAWRFWLIALILEDLIGIIRKYVKGRRHQPGSVVYT